MKKRLRRRDIHNPRAKFAKKVRKITTKSFMATSAAAMVVGPLMSTSLLASAQEINVSQFINSVYASKFENKSEILENAIIQGEIKKAKELIDNKWESNSVENIEDEIERQKKFFEDEEVDFNVYVVQWGDTLSKIAEATGLSVSHLAKVNDLSDANVLLTGDLLIGVSEKVEESLEADGSLNNSTTPSQPSSPSDNNDSEEETNPVKPGDNEENGTDKPTDPVNPDEDDDKETGEPTNPVEPGDDNEDGDTEEPTDPVNPGEEGGDTDQPTDPVEPGDDDENGDTEEPTDPVNPGDEDGDTDQPTDPTTPGEDGEDAELPSRYFPGAVKVITSENTSLAGSATTNSTVVITLPNGSKHEVKADNNANWSFDLPEGVVLEDGEKILFVFQGQDGLEALQAVVGGDPVYVNPGGEDVGGVEVDEDGNLIESPEENEGEDGETGEPENTAPEITLVQDTVNLLKGSNFEVLSYVKNVTDAEEDLTIYDIKVSGSVNTEIVGSYELTLSIEDSGGMKDTKILTVIVSDSEEDLIYTDVPQYPEYVFSTKSEAEGYAFTVLEKQEVLFYSSFYTIQVDGGYRVWFDYNYQYLNNEPPVIETPETGILINVGDSFDVLDYVTITDDQDSESQLNIFVDSNVDVTVPGSYSATITATDRYSATTSATVTITVQETLPKPIEPEDPVEENEETEPVEPEQPSVPLFSTQEEAFAYGNSVLRNQEERIYGSYYVIQVQGGYEVYFVLISK